MLQRAKFILNGHAEPWEEQKYVTDEAETAGKLLRLLLLREAPAKYAESAITGLSGGRYFLSKQRTKLPSSGIQGTPNSNQRQCYAKVTLVIS